MRKKRIIHQFYDVHLVQPSSLVSLSLTPSSGISQGSGVADFKCILLLDKFITLCDFD